MSAHTPGPWTVGGRFAYDTTDGSDMFQYTIVGQIGGKEGRTIAEVGLWRDRPNALADACLIAAAPELLEALDRMHHRVRPMYHLNPYDTCPTCRLIARAKGES